MYFDSYITGKRIQQLRKTKGLTQEQFAAKLNISDRHLGKIERGEGTASIDLLVEVAISLNTTLDFFDSWRIWTLHGKGSLMHRSKSSTRKSRSSKIS